MAVNQLTQCDLHPAEPLTLTCGGCQKPICTVCLTLTGEGPRCQACMARLNNGGQTTGQAQPVAVTGEVLPAGDEVARADAAREAYYATEPKIYCTRHPQTETLLRCGRCDTPICPKCMVHAGVGIRCPECAANPHRTVGRQAEIQAAAARGRAAPQETGHRNYWYKGRAYGIVTPRYYALAILAGLGVAIVGGVLWGLIMNDFLGQVVRQSGVNPRSLRGAILTSDNWGLLIARSMDSSLHLIPEIAIGLGIGTAIERLTDHRVGPGLQIIAGLSFLAAILVSALTIGARIYQGLNDQFPPIGDLFNSALKGVSESFSGGNLTVLIFWGIGIAVAVIRLKR